ncbi:hypothetical protein SS1G_01120 [Sclerotinia sclerotiorum 1980 UF-70]|uniref:Uncharacterized protein n=1 Tax=Sclerotinia sclerotiorum (strain ATCC 18683 / 1980 / Ss-1) TaxID=665079 RepID=A7E744_SCLS1|nr:hypothetical protein SS1G_01120 [Sclerotinia sclerotiorum 1980 UF-70]EDN96196.1 hypothetical protein SS1G_01120 [Sclerotinia sclerotiorum 1980 UF-70]
MYVMHLHTILASQSAYINCLIVSYIHRDPTSQLLSTPISRHLATPISGSLVQDFAYPHTYRIYKEYTPRIRTHRKLIREPKGQQLNPTFVHESGEKKPYPTVHTYLRTDSAGHGGYAVMIWCFELRFWIGLI